LIPPLNSRQARWTRLEAKTVKLEDKLPDALHRAFRKFFPGGVDPSFYVLSKPKGLGSLGRRRFLALASWEGGMIAREAKDVVPSACLWASGKRVGEGNPWLEKTVDAAVRCADPYYTVKGRWLVRRLGPDCSRIDIDQLRNHEDLASLIYCMGWETANIHLGTRKIRKTLVKALQDLPKAWLKDSAQSMYEKILRDWKNFKNSKDKA
jgi:hypothetical protein